MGRWSLHTRTDEAGCHVYLVPVESDGRYAEAVVVGDPITFPGPVTITSDDRGRKLVSCEGAPQGGYPAPGGRRRTRPGAS